MNNGTFRTSQNKFAVYGRSAREREKKKTTGGSLEVGTKWFPLLSETSENLPYVNNPG